MNAGVGTPRIGWVGRDRHRTGAQAAEERSDVLEAGRHEQHDAIARIGVRTQAGRDAEGALPQLAESEPPVLHAVAAHEPEHHVVPLPLGTVCQKLDQGSDALGARVVVQWFVRAHTCDSSGGTEAVRGLRACIQPAWRYQRYVSWTPSCSVRVGSQPSSPLMRLESQVHQRGRASRVL